VRRDAAISRLCSGLMSIGVRSIFAM